METRCKLPMPPPTIRRRQFSSSLLLPFLASLIVLIAHPYHVPISHAFSLESKQLWLWMDPRYPAFSTTTTRRRSDILQMSATSSASLGSSSGGEGIGFGSSGLRLQGLSKYHQSILSRMAHERQRFVSGKFPVVVEATETPTLRWLGRGKTSAAASQVLLVNGTSVERSLASYDRFQWLDDKERAELHDKYALVSWELLAVISLPKPGYVTVLPGYGAGSTAASARFLESTSRWDRWKRGGQVLLDELEERVCRPDRLWVTGFSLTGRSGTLHSIDTNTGHMESCNTRTSKSLKWPNEVNSVPSQYVDSPADGNKLENTKSETTTTTTSGTTTTTPQLADLKDAILVSDGFLIPGKDQGGIHVVKQPGNPNSEWAVCLTEITGYDRWFYHRAIWTDLTGDGRKSILTARAKSPFGSSNGNIHGNSNGSGSGSGKKTKPPVGQLVCLEMPQPYRIDEKTGTPLERDGTVFDPLSSQHLPWKQHVLAEGPDVMFNVVDMDPEDGTVEVIASQFFGEKVTLHSIKRGQEPKVTFSKVIDDKVGKAFGCILSDLEEGDRDHVQGYRVIDAGSTVKSLREGDTFSHLLVTSHECSFREEKYSKSNLADTSEPLHRKLQQFKNKNILNGFLGGEATSSEEPMKTTTIIPNRHGQKQQGANGGASSNSAIDGGSLFAYRVPEGRGKWKTEEWTRTTVASGFKVQGQLNNMINPGAPGFVYTFHAQQEDDLNKDGNGNRRRPLIAVAGDCAESAYIFRPVDEDTCSKLDDDDCDSAAQYDLMCEIKCGATVGSIAVGYGDICDQEQESGYAKLYIPCYERDKIFVFGLGSGED